MLVHYVIFEFELNIFGLKYAMIYTVLYHYIIFDLTQFESTYMFYYKKKSSQM
jgi:hypothetical protein